MFEGYACIVYLSVVFGATAAQLCAYVVARPLTCDAPQLLTALFTVAYVFALALLFAALLR
jgi:hypothetical protein